MYYRAFVREHYLQVPEDLRDTLAARSGGGRHRCIRGERLEHGSAPGAGGPGGGLPGPGGGIRPGDPAHPAGEDFVGYFLTESRRGYCMHFASAAVLMLRTLGVPARYASRLCGRHVAGETVEVPDYNAHAWAEVYCDGYGWQPVEVTPGFEGEFPWLAGAEEPPAPTGTVPPAPDPDAHAQRAGPHPLPAGRDARRRIRPARRRERI